ncbi:hypothetical protein AURDEDRAFT_186597 [Auricularia subglabra TFB-10046 SS5]|nr:hypothetical protein AURDEDRAFT_186597 [Auricularia subglabra TFB-10046 SS5]
MSADAGSIYATGAAPEGEQPAAARDKPVFMKSLPEHVPKAISRFASPSCPWPWAGDTESKRKKAAHGGSQPAAEPPGLFDTDHWGEYPTLFFPNWTKEPVERCGLAALIKAPAEQGLACTAYAVDVTIKNDNSALFTKLNPDAPATSSETDSVINLLKNRPEGLRLRCLSVENISGRVMQAMGAFYRIEPFFFSSAINRISSRYHEQFKAQKGDHMFITLPFLRVTQVDRNEGEFEEPEILPAEVDSINVFVPLSLVGRNKKIKHTLQQDMLAVYLVRIENHQTLITIHPGPYDDSALDMQDRIYMAGQGVYWGNLMRKTGDPIFVLLIVMWSALYLWDEAMEVLYSHITYFEIKVLNFQNAAEVKFAPQLHAVRAHLLYYDDLLQELNTCLEFIGNVGVLNQSDEDGKALLKKEIDNLSYEVARLRRQRTVQDSRLGNVMKLVFSKLTITETQESLRHGQSMKQITYLTMIYLPASFIASIFGMNVTEIVPQTNGTLAHYFAVMVPLAVMTAWLAVAMNERLTKPEGNMVQHMLWPVTRLSLFLKAGRDYISPPSENKGGSPTRAEIHHGVESMTGSDAAIIDGTKAGDSKSNKRRNKTPPGSREASVERDSATLFDASFWGKYPTRFFPNWTHYSIDRCGLAKLLAVKSDCTTFAVDVTIKDDYARFSTAGEHKTTEEMISLLKNRPDGLRLRCLCVENISGEMTKVLGTFYRIEPFFFSSAINRIASRYHEQFKSQNGDHMFITLPFLRVTELYSPKDLEDPEILPAEDTINVFHPLPLVGHDRRLKHTLEQDMLAVYLVRAQNHRTLITIHPGPLDDSAETMQDLIHRAGKGIYWGNLMRKTDDPIFVVLIVMWTAMCLWDEAMDVLYSHITYFEGKVLKIKAASDVEFTPQLHAVRAHLLFYDDLLLEFDKCLAFIQHVGVLDHSDAEGRMLLEQEVDYLKQRVERLRRQKDIQDSRLNNVIKLVFSKLTITETQATQRHGQAMKQITYLTMIYLPASFIASVFGMNVVEIVPQTNGTLAHYFAVMVPLAAITTWLAIMMDKRLADQDNKDGNTARHLLWPFDLLLALWTNWTMRGGSDHQLPEGRGSPAAAPPTTASKTGPAVRKGSHIRLEEMEEGHASGKLPDGTQEGMAPTPNHSVHEAETSDSAALLAPATSFLTKDHTVAPDPGT